ncbi:MAG: hypothetical protein ABIY55_19755 [Kofleriaceae bacterium]
MQRTPPNPSRASSDREPEAGDDRLGKPHRARQDGAADDDGELGVAHRINPLPLREAEEEELSEADILEELDLEELDADDLARMKRPDA